MKVIAGTIGVVVGLDAGKVLVAVGVSDGIGVAVSVADICVGVAVFN